MALSLPRTSTALSLAQILRPHRKNLNQHNWAHPFLDLHPAFAHLTLPIPLFAFPVTCGFTNYKHYDVFFENIFTLNNCLIRTIHRYRNHVLQLTYHHMHATAAHLETILYPSPTCRSSSYITRSSPFPRITSTSRGARGQLLLSFALIPDT